jgi:hypothetical protein
MRRDIVARPLTAQSGADDEAVAALFDATVVLGHPLQRPLVGADGYRRVCLGWYLGAGRADAAVATDGDRVVGYALMCTDEEAYDSWVRRELTRFTCAMIWRLVTFRIDRDSLRFWWWRARDVTALRSSHRSSPMAAHVHLNVGDGARIGSTALALLGHLDERARELGEPGWWGEMNARVGSRERALRRLGIDVVDRQPNHTLSALLGEPVERLTVVRRLAPTNLSSSKLSQTSRTDLAGTLPASKNAMNSLLEPFR